MISSSLQEKIAPHLAAWGFQNAPLGEERGDFSVRGGIVDIFPPAHSRPMRLEFFSDRLESIREFDPSTQRSRDRHEALLLLPMKEFSLKRERIEIVEKGIEKRAEELEMGRKEKNSLLESVRSGVPFAGMEFLIPYFYSNLSPLFSYLPAETLVWLDQAAQVGTGAERFARVGWGIRGKA